MNEIIIVNLTNEELERIISALRTSYGEYSDEKDILLAIKLQGERK